MPFLRYWADCSFISLHSILEASLVLIPFKQRTPADVLVCRNDKKRHQANIGTRMRKSNK